MEKTTTTEKKKMMKPSSTPQYTLNPSLPYDLLLNIIARISRLYYPTLSLVSKSFRSLIASPELYKTRSLLGQTESCLYVCLHCKNDYHWFTLCHKPNQKKNNEKYVLATVPIQNVSPVYSSNLVAVGSDIYNIGLSCWNYTVPSSRVSILDCRSHTWREAPSLPVELFLHSASVLDRKIYVAGRYGDDGNEYYLKNCVNVFNTVTQIWDPEPISCSEAKGVMFNGCKTAFIDGKFYVVTGMMEEANVVAYDSKEGRWDMVEPRMGSFITFSDDYCEVENVLYSVLHGEIRWYDTEVNKWRILKGLVGLPKFPTGGNVKLAEYGGKLAVLWDEDRGHNHDKMIWCAEIVLVRLKSCEIWGIVEWFEYVLAVPISHYLVKVIAVTVL